MTTMSAVSTYLVQTLGGFFLTLVILRFLLQLVKADFYNPISLFIVNTTQLVSSPIRALLPAFRSFDVASLVLAIFIQWMIIQLTYTINNLGVVNFFIAISWGFVGVLSVILNIYMYGLLATIIISWIAPQSQHPAITLINQIIYPAMEPFRKIIPSLGMIDLSPMLFFIVLNVIDYFIYGIATELMLPSHIVVGI
jgi:YggT family protein